MCIYSKGNGGRHFPDVRQCLETKVDELGVLEREALTPRAISSAASEVRRDGYSEGIQCNDSMMACGAKLSLRDFPFLVMKVFIAIITRHMNHIQSLVASRGLAIVPLKTLQLPSTFNAQDVTSFTVFHAKQSWSKTLCPFSMLEHPPHSSRRPCGPLRCCSNAERTCGVICRCSWHSAGKCRAR